MNECIALELDYSFSVVWNSERYTMDVCSRMWAKCELIYKNTTIIMLHIIRSYSTH